MKNELLVSLGMKQLMPQQRSDLLPNPVALTGTNIQTNELVLPGFLYFMVLEFPFEPYYLIWPR